MGILVHESSLRGHYESPSLPHWHTLLAWCLRKMVTQGGLELYLTQLLSSQGPLLDQNP